MGRRRKQKSFTQGQHSRTVSCNTERHAHRGVNNRRFNQNREWHNHHSTETGCNTPIASSSTVYTGQNRYESEMPGYYYDPVKKKYFKILDNCQTSVPGIMTNEKIAQMQAKQKMADMLHFMYSGKMSPGAAFYSRQNESINVTDLINNRACNFNVTRSSKSTITCSLARQFSLRGNASFIPNSEHAITQTLAICPKVVDVERDGRLLCLWREGDTSAQRLQMMDITAVNKLSDDETASDMDIQLDPVGALVVQVVNNITSMCWMSCPSAPNTVLYTTTSALSVVNSSSMVLIRNLDSTSVHAYRAGEFTVNAASTHSCAFNKDRGMFSIGTNAGSCFFNLDHLPHSSHERIEVPGPTVEAQQFAGDYLYCGYASGIVKVYDVRGSCNYKVASLKSYNIGASHLQLCNSELYMVAGYVDGSIKTWDLRMNRVVMSFEGRKGSYVTIPFHLDRTETMLCSSDEDCYIHMWDFRTGELLRTLPTPTAISRETIPLVAYSSAWGGRKHSAKYPGLISCVQGQLYYYC